NDLYSHIYLIPAISVYLAWTQRKRWTPDAAPAWWPAAILATAGIALLAFERFPAGTVDRLQDQLSMSTLAFVCLFSGAWAALLGGSNFKGFLFPIVFLIFMVPLPIGFERAFESFLQQASADASFVLLKISGMPLFRDGTLFVVPGLSFEVAPE